MSKNIEPNHESGANKDNESADWLLDPCVCPTCGRTTSGERWVAENGAPACDFCAGSYGDDSAYDEPLEAEDFDDPGPVVD